MRIYENCTIREDSLFLDKKDNTGNICFQINGEVWECKSISTIKELIKKLEAYGNRDDYIRDMEELITHLQRRIEKINAILIE